MNASPLDFHLREALRDDISAMAEIRAADWGEQPYWVQRIGRYMSSESGPQHSLPDRRVVVAVRNGLLGGLIAGHLTDRFGCDGELQWISVRPECRGRGVASSLFVNLREWFLVNGARRICVNVEPSNDTARRFYSRHGAVDFKPYWMIWDDIATSIR